MTIKIVKTESLKNEFRRKATKTSVVLEALKDLNPGESVLISAKEADRWKVPANASVGSNPLFNSGRRCSNILILI